MNMIMIAVLTTLAALLICATVLLLKCAKSEDKMLAQLQESIKNIESKQEGNENAVDEHDA